MEIEVRVSQASLRKGKRQQAARSPKLRSVELAWDWSGGADFRKQACERESGSKLRAVQSFARSDWLGIGAVERIFASKLAKGKAAASCTHSSFARSDWLGIGAVERTFASKLAKGKAAASCTQSKASLRVTEHAVLNGAR